MKKLQRIAEVKKMKTRLFENFDFDGKGLSIATGTGIICYTQIFGNPVSLYYSALCHKLITIQVKEKENFQIIIIIV